jgi:hypothetical protein
MQESFDKRINPGYPACSEAISPERLRMDPLASFCEDCEEFPIGHDTPIRPTDQP